jgi:hypothetical protein
MLPVRDSRRVVALDRLAIEHGSRRVEFRPDTPVATLVRLEELTGAQTHQLRATRG